MTAEKSSVRITALNKETGFTGQAATSSATSVNKQIKHKKYCIDASFRETSELSMIATMTIVSTSSGHRKGRLSEIQVS